MLFVDQRGLLKLWKIFRIKLLKWDRKVGFKKFDKLRYGLK